MQEEEIKERWRSYFEKLLNENHMGNKVLEGSGDIGEIQDSRFFRRIRVFEVNSVLKNIKI